MKIKSFIIVCLIIVSFVYYIGMINHFDNSCTQRGHDGVLTMLGVPMACYDNNNPLGINDKRGYEYSNLYIG